MHQLQLAFGFVGLGLMDLSP